MRLLRTCLRIIATVGLLAACAVPASAADDPPPTPAPRIALPQAVAQADAVALVRIGHPSTDQDREPGSGDPPFVRRRWRLSVVDVLKGAGLRVHAELRADEALWRQELAAHKACAARRGAEPCAMPTGPVYVSQLAREPRSGDTVLVMLRRDGAEWRLAWENAFDLASQADRARALLPAAKGKP